MGGAISIIAYVIPAGFLTRRAPLRRIKRLGAELSRAVLRIPAAHPVTTITGPFDRLRRRALHGRPEGEVYFPQEHPPGREARLTSSTAGNSR